MSNTTLTMFGHFHTTKPTSQHDTMEEGEAEDEVEIKEVTEGEPPTHI